MSLISPFVHYGDPDAMINYDTQMMDKYRGTNEMYLFMFSYFGYDVLPKISI